MQDASVRGEKRARTHLPLLYLYLTTTAADQLLLMCAGIPISITIQSPINIVLTPDTRHSLVV